MKTTILRILSSGWFWMVVLFLVGFGAGFWGRGVWDRWTAPEQDTAYVKLSEKYINTQDSLRYAEKKLLIAEEIVKKLLMKNTEKGIEIIYKYAYRDSLIIKQAAGKNYTDLIERFKVYSLGNPKLNNYGFDSSVIMAMNLFCNKADKNEEKILQLLERDSISTIDKNILAGKLDNMTTKFESCTNELQRVTSEPRITIKEEEYPVRMRIEVYAGYKNGINRIGDWKRGGGFGEISAGVDLKRVPVRIGIEKSYNTDYEVKLKAGFIYK